MACLLVLQRDLWGFYAIGISSLTTKKNKETNKETNKQNNRQIDRQTERQADRVTDRQTHRQTDRHTHIKVLRVRWTYVHLCEQRRNVDHILNN